MEILLTLCTLSVIIYYNYKPPFFELQEHYGLIKAKMVTNGPVKDTNKKRGQLSPSFLLILYSLLRVGN